MLYPVNVQDVTNPRKCYNPIVVHRSLRRSNDRVPFFGGRHLPTNWFSDMKLSVVVIIALFIVAGCRVTLAVESPTPLPTATTMPTQEPTQQPSPGIAPFFADAVRYWQSEIKRWASQYSLDPNIVATLMQLESCGNPTAISSAGASGLFQVMPYHFAEDENPFHPETNADRGLSFFNSCLVRNDGVVGRAFACYNGGYYGTLVPMQDWPEETRKYYFWADRIYYDSKQQRVRSPALDAWFSTRGEWLCKAASLFVETRM